MTDTRDLFAVVIPLFNKEQAIGSTIESVLRQELLPDELIIVDDGSTDSSVTVAQRALADAPEKLKWRIVTQGNAGECAARNRGADAANARYVLFLDADDRWLPGCVAEFERLARTFPTATALSVRLARVNKNGDVVPDRIGLADDFFGIVDAPLSVYSRGYGLMSSSSVGVRRDVFQYLGGFPMGAVKGGDLYFWVRLLSEGQLAHSAAALSVWREEYSAVASRRGIIPYHFEYFLGTSEGKNQLASNGATRFLSSNLLVQIASHRAMGDYDVARRLQQLSRPLPLATRLICAAIMLAPAWCLRAAASARRVTRSGERQNILGPAR
jgi:glycosyltransferase involved in cell wall biosynthesis